MSLSSLIVMSANAVHRSGDYRDDFDWLECREGALMDAPQQFPSGSARFDDGFDVGFCGCRECAGRIFVEAAPAAFDCPPAGAPQGVNEAESSLAAPSASGQRVGARRVLRDWAVFSSLTGQWLATRRASSERGAIAALRREFRAGKLGRCLPRAMHALPANFSLF